MPHLRSSRPFLLLALGLWACTQPAGCSRSSPAPLVKPGEGDNLSKIQRAYDQATKKLGRPPARVTELYPFLKEVGDPERILCSPRDGLPYVIICGVDFRKLPITTMPPPIMAYEQFGANGYRYVLTVMGVMPMRDEEFAKAKLLKGP